MIPVNNKIYIKYVFLDNSSRQDEKLSNVFDLIFDEIDNSLPYISDNQAQKSKNV